MLPGAGVVGGSLMASTTSVAARPTWPSTLEWRAAGSIRSAATAGPTDIRLARATAVGDRGESVAGRQSCAIALEACGDIQGHGAQCRRRAGGPVAPDRRARVPAPRAAACRERQPEEPGARGRRQPSPDDVGADELDWPRTRSTTRVDLHNAEALQMMVPANRATPDTMGEILPTSRPRAPARRRSSITIGRCYAAASWTRNPSTCTPSSMRALPLSRTT